MTIVDPSRFIRDRLHELGHGSCIGPEPEPVMTAVVATLRHILALHSDQFGDGRCVACSRPAPCATLIVLAETFSGHPDYAAALGAA